MMDRTVAFIERKQLLKKGDRILVGVSGGIDSMALLHFIWENKQKWNIEVSVAHVDHMFRGQESLDDLYFVKEYCNERGIPCKTTRINVSAFAEEFQLNTQVAARVCRYRFYEECMTDLGATKLLLGHHGDDQLETILMRLTRGASVSGYAGIPLRRPFATGEIVRPFLKLAKKEIEEYCAHHSVPFREDSSNKKDAYTRNRFRKNVLPFLKQENTQVIEHFQQFSETLQADDAFLQELTNVHLNKVMKRKTNDTVVISVETFNAMPYPLQRRAIQLILNYLYEEIPATLSSIHLELIFSRLQESQPSGISHLPKGLFVRRSYDECYFTFQPANGLDDGYSFVMEEEGSYTLPNGDVIIAEVWTEYPKEGIDQNSMVLPKRFSPFFVRTRKEGDRMTLKGMNGTRKIKDIFIDCKIPLSLRASWPIIESAEGQIVWLPGLKKSSFEAKESEQVEAEYILLTFVQRSS